VQDRITKSSPWVA